MKRKALKIAAATAFIGLTGCSEQTEPEQVTPPLSKEHKMSLNQMQAAFDCYQGFLKLKSIDHNDVNTINRPYGADQKPDHIGQPIWDYWIQKRVRAGTKDFFYDMSAVSPQETKRDMMEFFMEKAQNPNLVFYLEGYTDGVPSKEGLNGKPNAPKYQALKTSLQRVTGIMEHMLAAGIKIEQICRAPKGRHAPLLLDDPNQRKVTLKYFDSGLE